MPIDFVSVASNPQAPVNASNVSVSECPHHFTGSPRPFWPRDDAHTPSLLAVTYEAAIQVPRHCEAHSAEASSFFQRTPLNPDGCKFHH